jgi:hypothetical protein
MFWFWYDEVRFSVLACYLAAMFFVGASTAIFAASPQPDTPSQEEMMSADEVLSQDVGHIIRLADEKIGGKDWTAANSLLKRGLAALGDSYLLSDTLDDSATMLVLADLEERKGNIERAVRFRRNVLWDRHTLFQRKIKQAI